MNVSGHRVAGRRDTAEKGGEAGRVKRKQEVKKKLRGRDEGTVARIYV